MEWLNYHHLLYFWLVAREGGLAPAGVLLRLSPPTLSGQIRKLEDRLGARLFIRRGRRLELTELGRIVHRYADEIFTLGGELLDTVQRGAPDRSPRFTVGLADVVPKMLVRRLLEPALRRHAPMHLVCREDRHDRLLAELAQHTIDVMIADEPVPPGSPIRAYSHLLGETGITVLGVARLASPRRPGFPRSLDGAPLLLPLAGTALRRTLDAWFASLELRPAIVAEAQDSALLEAFAADGMGLLVTPTAMAATTIRQHGLVRVGATDEVRERYWAISAERRITHPAVVAIREAARTQVFPLAASSNARVVSVRSKRQQSRRSNRTVA